MTHVADAIHEVTAKGQNAIDEGYRIEVLLAIAERIDQADSPEDDVPVDELASIAQTELRIPTLEPRGSDTLDFHEVGVAGLKKALIRAYRLGLDSCRP